MPLSNVCLVVTPANLAAFKTYYKAVLAPLGYGVWREDDKFIGFRQGDHDPDFFMIAKPESERLPTRNVHFGFRAASQEVVKAYHAAALAAGGTDNGAPGPRDYGEAKFFAAFALDKAGNNCEVSTLEEYKKDL